MALECRGVRTALLFLCLWLNTALAAPFAVRVGEERLALDAPPGFSDTQFTGSPRLVEIAESLTTASNRILLFALEDEDLKRFTVGDPIELRRSVLIVTPRALEQQSLSLGGFRSYVAAARPAGDANPVRVLRNDPEITSVLITARAPPERPNQPERKVVSTRTLLLLRGKPLDISVVSRYDSEADLEWVRAATVRWIDELRRLNAR